MPKTVSNRQLRRTVVAQQHVLEEGLAPALRAVIANEEFTRARVEALEHQMESLEGAKKAHQVRWGTVWGRLGWLMVGR